MTRPWPRINGKGRNMLDLPPDYKPLDPGRVDTVDRVELQYWSKELRCTQAELTEAGIGPRLGGELAHAHDQGANIIGRERVEPDALRCCRVFDKAIVRSRCRHQQDRRIVQTISERCEHRSRR